MEKRSSAYSGAIDIALLAAHCWAVSISIPSHALRKPGFRNLKGFLLWSRNWPAPALGNPVGLVFSSQKGRFA